MPFALTVFMHAYACIEIKKIVGAPPKIDARVLENQRYFLPWPKFKLFPPSVTWAVTMGNPVKMFHDVLKVSQAV